MECDVCGEPLAEGALACPRCGNPVGRRAKGPETPEAAEPVSVTPEAQDVPLAPLEEDFIALAEEKVAESVSEEPGATPPTAPPGEGDESAVADASVLADQEVPPGTEVPPEQVPLDDKLTGGYKGPEGPSVGGAGTQTADDPFGLEITETAPPISIPDTESGGFSRATLRNVLVVIVTFIVVGGIITLAVYFGFLRENVTTPDPVGTVREFYEMAAVSDYDDLDTVAVQGAPIVETVQAVLFPYQKESTLELYKFSADTTKMDDTAATVEISELVIEAHVLESNQKYTKDLLSGSTKPYPMPSTVTLIKQDGKWLINS